MHVRLSPPCALATRPHLRACVHALMAAALISHRAVAQERSQQLPFAVVIVDVDRETSERQRLTYRSEGSDHELLFCVESWSTGETEKGVQHLTITRVRREREGRPHHIGEVGANCRDRDGKSLPMFHTHSDGNCQFSPGDLVTIAARGAPFEGLQCGERHFVWAFAWQVLSIIAAVEKQQLNAGIPP